MIFLHSFKIEFLSYLPNVSVNPLGEGGNALKAANNFINLHWKSITLSSKVAENSIGLKKRFIPTTQKKESNFYLLRSLMRSQSNNLFQ